MSHLFLNDVFWTLQGEGFHAGRRALFVRMPFCNLACSWCDTKFDTYKKWEEQEFNDKADEEPATFAVITGGEPTMHRHTPRVVELLKKKGFQVAVETNGTFKLPCDFDWVTCSPKRDSEFDVHADLWHHVNEFKYVVDSEFDFSVLDKHNVPSYAPKAIMSLSPEFNDMQNNVAKIIDYIKENPQWKLSLQTHKWINVP